MLTRLAAILVLLLGAAGPRPSGAAPDPGFKVLVEDAGVYRVTFEELAAAEPGLVPLPSAGLGITQGGEPVPVWVEDGGDGVFGPGDRLELLGEPLPGAVSYYSEDTRFNVYVLRFDHADPLRMTAGEAGEAQAGGAGTLACRERRHLEKDLLILRLRAGSDNRRQELWHWAKLVHNDEEPFRRTLDLRDLDAGSTAAVDVRVALRGWSEPRNKFKASRDVADHRVEVTLDGRLLASREWSGTDPFVVEAPPIPAAELAAGDHVLEVRVPGNDAGQNGKPLIDVVMLNWVEIDFPRATRIRAPRADAPDDTSIQARCELVRGEAGDGSLRLTRDAGRQLVVYGDSGSRSLLPAGGEGEVASTVAPAAADRSLVFSRPEDLRTAAAVVRDVPSHLADAANQADYVIISHPRLKAAVEPLAAVHRQRGLTVEVVDVDDVYDEFSHGIVAPKALRAFLDHAYHHWRRPAPRFVLLVGDASWDGRNVYARDENYADWTYMQREKAAFPKNESTPYEEGAGLNHRGLVPTWRYAAYQGHSASDNYFVAVDGDDHLPDMAIGRWPVVTPEEVAAIVDKTVAYVSAPEAGAWRRRSLFITNERPGFQRQSDLAADLLTAEGFTALKVYPASTETSNEHHTRELIESFDQGQLLVHFLGHGGRYIWRTGPPDFEKNHDLFTLDDLDRLQPNRRLPVVLSLTCYSAPFDHPNADSIGEKLLRIPGRGAVAVLGASWRTAPQGNWGRVLLDELTRPGTTIGGAVMRAKREIGHQDFVETYNLLGDPAAPVALPEAPPETAVATGAQPPAEDGSGGR